MGASHQLHCYHGSPTQSCWVPASTLVLHVKCEAAAMGEFAGRRLCSVGRLGPGTVVVGDRYQVSLSISRRRFPVQGKKSRLCTWLQGAGGTRERTDGSVRVVLRHVLLRLAFEKGKATLPRLRPCSLSCWLTCRSMGPLDFRAEPEFGVDCDPIADRTGFRGAARTL